MLSSIKIKFITSHVEKKLLLDSKKISQGHIHYYRIHNKPGNVGSEGYFGARGFDFTRRCHQNFSQPRDTQCDVHFTTSGKMESIQRHLSGRFANGLSSQNTNSLSRVAQRFERFPVHCIFEFGFLH